MINEHTIKVHSKVHTGIYLRNVLIHICENILLEGFYNNQYYY